MSVVFRMAAAGLGLCVLFVAGCCGAGPFTHAAPESREVLVAVHADAPVNIDGKLDDAVWRQARAYPLYGPNGEFSKEGGVIRLAWDKDYFYLGAELTDLDLVAEMRVDQEHLYRYGDAVELFLKPEGDKCFWELYVTPAGNKTTFFWPSRGRGWLPSMQRGTSGLRVAAVCNGTLDNWRDKDEGWTAEVAMPIKDLTQYGAVFAPGAAWRILVGRYNYSRYLDQRELTSAPALPKADFLEVDSYGALRIEE
ncbi:MAG TPA: carbohydrate-binding family 9-like protein [Candidatus Brocadiia bacterium]|nr:carbohydrate-binding family 9-like protein [Candidatus Brocadiia bacterium]